MKNHATLRMAYLSIATSLATMALKFGAWYLTDSVSLLSDAIESVVNLSAGLIALTALTIAARPADADHAYGHDKAEYFSSGAEGTLILVAAVAIIYTAVGRFLHPAALESLGPGLMVSVLAAGLNLATAQAMLRVARKHDSITLEADALHLMTDVWTSVGVVAGLAVVMFAPPSWQILDPLMAVAVGLNIIYTGFNLLRRSWSGLMDAALPAEEVGLIEREINRLLPAGSSFHDLRTRKSGARRFVDCHLLVPGENTVNQAHDLCDRIEAALQRALPHTAVTIHVEPLETQSAGNE
ncbi:MAG: cation diffusion facilitator family transporter [Betaproteobacteria bacterium]|nr:cation diffusion facilitator family transporter [Betaproteobacteria bacterium]